MMADSALVNKLNEEILRVLAAADVKAVFFNAGMDVPQIRNRSVVPFARARG